MRRATVSGDLVRGRAVPEDRPRGRQHGHANDITRLLTAAAHLPVDVEGNVLTSKVCRLDGCARRAVVIIEDACPFQQVSAVFHSLKPVAIDE
jgi:hypothetical protein